MQAPKYSFAQGSFSMRPDSRAMVADLLLTLLHRPRCLKCHQPHTTCCRQPQIPVAYYLLAPSLWYPILAIIHTKRCESSIFWAIWACKLVCLLDVILEKDQKTWFLNCNSTWFWGIYYSAKPSYLVHSFEAWPSYYDPVSKALMHCISSAGKRSSILKAWRIVFLWFLILSGDQDLLSRKRKDGICN